MKLRALAFIAVFFVASVSGSSQTSTPEVQAATWTYSSPGGVLPAYTLRINRDGIVQYNGRANVKVFGPKTWSIAERSATSLLDRLAAGDFLAGDRAGRFLADPGSCGSDKSEKSVTVVLEANGHEEMPIATCYNETLQKITADAESITSAEVFTVGHDSPSEAAIRAVLDAQVAAWNRHDIDGFMRGYWMSKDLTFFSGGSETHGWTETLERYRKSYQSSGKQMGQLTFGDLRTEMLSPESAFVRGSWKLTMPDGKTPHGLFTLIFRKLPDGWRIIHDSTGGS